MLTILIITLVAFFCIMLLIFHFLARVREVSEDYKRLQNKFNFLKKTMLSDVEGMFNNFEKRISDTMDVKDLAIREEMDNFKNAQYSLMEGYDESFEQIGKKIKIFKEKSERSLELTQSFQGDLQSLSEKIDLFEESLQKIYKSELRKSFKLFDHTVSSVLSEMKSELQRGVGRIEEIEEVVHGKEQLEQKLLSEDFSKEKSIEHNLESKEEEDTSDEPMEVEEEIILSNGEEEKKISE